MKTHKPQSRFVFVGNHECLDFVNTLILKGGQPVDLLEDFYDFLEWLTDAGILDGSQAKQIQEKWGEHPQGKQILRRARLLRGALREMAERMARGRSIPKSTIAQVNGLLRLCAGYEEVVRLQGRFKRQIHRTFDEPAHLLAPIAQSASDLLCEADPALIKKCGNRSCILFFYDTTKNHARNWCSMRLCGNRIKVAAHYRRKRKTTGKP